MRSLRLSRIRWPKTYWAILVASALCSNTWPAGSPSLQVARDYQSKPKPIDTFPRIAIIIDDIGYNLGNSTKAANLPGPVSLAILPFSPHGRVIAKLATNQNKTIMLHAPMSSIWDKPLDLGALTTDMPRENFVATLSASLAALPNIQGVNNHMGSQLTQQRQPMAWLMEELRKRSLFFVDSRTIDTSLAWQTALNYGVPTAQRDIFLDNEANFPAIAQQFGLLLVTAKHRGQALAIAHPYPETLRFLQLALPMLEHTRIRLVPVSDLLSTPHPIPTARSIRAKRQVDSPREVVSIINFLTD